MALQNVPDKSVEEAAKNVKNFLSRSIQVIEVEPVKAGFVESRTPGKGFKQELPEYSIYLRLKTAPLEDLKLLETRRGLFKHISDSLENMEMNGLGPDTMIVAEDHPPERLNKPLVYYVEATV